MVFFPITAISSCFSEKPLFIVEIWCLFFWPNCHLGCWLSQALVRVEDLDLDSFINALHRFDQALRLKDGYCPGWRLKRDNLNYAGPLLVSVWPWVCKLIGYLAGRSWRGCLSFDALASRFLQVSHWSPVITAVFFDYWYFFHVLILLFTGLIVSSVIEADKFTVAVRWATLNCLSGRFTLEQRSLRLLCEPWVHWIFDWGKAEIWLVLALPNFASKSMPPFSIHLVTPRTMSWACLPWVSIQFL